MTKNKNKIPKNFLTFEAILKKAKVEKKEIKDLTKIEGKRVANAIKKWAKTKGGVHYTHWFQSLSGRPSEKHDTIEYFSFDNLTQGEPDASSFPNGGLRDTFEARGYTSWDTTSPIFIKTYSGGYKVLCIPTILYSYNGHSLDNKLPLLRSQELINIQSIRLLQALGNVTSKSVVTCVGAEQEFFLIPLDILNKRPDIKLTGRSLFGQPSPRGQEGQDHYFGTMHGDVLKFMVEAENELKPMGVKIETKHNEVAPSQFEFAVRFSTGSIATDQNQLLMETLERVAERHGFACLLHEKPFAGLNVSGKHNNLSLQTDDGIQLFLPGKDKESMDRFLLFVCAVIRGAHKYAGLLRMSAANAGNAHRLGGHEAPPAIISVYLGRVISDLLQKVADSKEISFSKKKSMLDLGNAAVAQIDKHSTDRNRTSPLAFTSNKFEFRMVPSSISIAMVNTILNTIVAEGLDEFATRLIEAESVDSEISSIIKDTLEDHGSIVFNGDNYSKEWLVESKKRGLPNITSTVDAICEFQKDSSINLFEKYKILSRDEIEARVNINLEQYINQINVEARVAINMLRTQYIPAVYKSDRFYNHTTNLLNTCQDIDSKVTELSEKLDSLNKKESIKEKADLYEKSITEKLLAVRYWVDEKEATVPKDLWPVPPYTEILFHLR